MMMRTKGKRGIGKNVPVMLIETKGKGGVGETGELNSEAAHSAWRKRRLLATI